SRLEEQLSVSYLGAPPWFREALGASRVVLFSNSPFVQMKAVVDGIGIGLLPCAQADSDPLLIRFNPEEPALKRPVWLITHPDLRRVAKIRLVSNAIAETFARQAPLLRSGSLAQRGTKPLQRRIKLHPSAEKPGSR